MTNNEIIKLYRGLDRLSQDDSLKFSVATCFLLFKNKKILTPVIESIKETRMILLKKYGTPQDGGITIPNERLPEFQKEYNELMDTENEIELNKISIEDLKDIKIDMKTMEDLFPIIK